MTIETITHESGWYAEIWHDQNTESPLEYEETFSITYRAGSRYILGNESISDVEDWLIDKVSQFVPGYDSTFSENIERLGEERALAAAWRHFNRHYIALPVFAYIHSGVALNCGGFSCPWDSGQSGMIYASRDRIRKEWKAKRIDTAQIKKTMRAIVKEFGRWANGECYGFAVYDPEGEPDDISCGGFIGFEYAEEQARESLEHAIQADKDNRAAQIAGFITKAAEAMDSTFQDTY